jgi:hypothetical protein
MAVVARMAPPTENMVLFMGSVPGLNRTGAALRSRLPADPFAGARRHYIGPAEFFERGSTLRVFSIRPGMVLNCLATSSDLKPVVVRKLVHGAVMSAVNRIDAKKPVNFDIH